MWILKFYITYPLIKIIYILVFNQLITFPRSTTVTRVTNEKELTCDSHWNFWYRQISKSCNAKRGYTSTLKNDVCTTLYVKICKYNVLRNLQRTSSTSFFSYAKFSFYYKFYFADPKACYAMLLHSNILDIYFLQHRHYHRIPLRLFWEEKVFNWRFCPGNFIHCNSALSQTSLQLKQPKSFNFPSKLIRQNVIAKSCRSLYTVDKLINFFF